MHGGKAFAFFSNVQHTQDSPFQILITQIYIENQQETEMWYDTTDEVLEYLVNGIRLRDIITQVEVRVRTI